jgi:hypothetical protein
MYYRNGNPQICPLGKNRATLCSPVKSVSGDSGPRTRVPDLSWAGHGL